MIAAAEHWARAGRGGTDQRASDAELLGIKIDFEVEAANDEFSVEPENWPALLLFIDGCSTQWRLGPMGHYIGLDYPGVKTVLDLTVPRSERAAIFQSIQVMERAALAVFNEKS
ncbi:DUF1799 domain-containing protein [Methylococcaceae bacterium WWC4]|nr:DUF1799 domain-containing protein [Methylococcaceae bacterium WWC4]